MSLKNAVKTETANRVELEIVVDAETFEKAVQAAYRKNVGKINVPGFRKGKAPRALIEKLYGAEVFYEDAMNAVYPDALDGAIKESGYEFVEDKIDLDVVSVGKEGMTFKAVITVKPEIEIEGYFGLKAEKPDATVTDADVDAELAALQDRQARLVTVEGRAAQLEDTVTFDFEGFVDGVAFEGGKGENYSLKLGSGQFIPGFEEQIVGKSVDEEFDVNVTFPEEYHAAELAGKPAVFKCKLHEIKNREVPELNDDLAKDCSEFDTLDELKADTRKKLEEKKAAEADNAYETALAEQLAGLVQGEIPEAMYENAVNDQVNSFDQRLRMQGLELAQYLQFTGMTMDDFRKNFRPQAELQTKVRLALEAIAKKENVEVTEEDINAEYDKMAEQYNMEADKIKALINADAIKADKSVEKAMTLVKENAKVAKKTAKKSTAKKAKAEEKTEE
ncbi:MAG: trigger factor [Clostridia bacterium]|nr:trigger factor [Clostridia bacterium]